MATPTPRRPPRFKTEHAETNRVEAFSDGVIAIVMTLLILDLKLPHLVGGEAALWRALAGQLPVFISWVISFLYVLVVWVNHHSFFHQLQKTDRGLLWLNGLFLLCLSFTPFPTALAGQYFAARPPMVLLSAAMFLTSSLFSLMRWYAGSVGNLMQPGISMQIQRAAMQRSLLGPLMYGIAIVLAFLWPIGAIIVQAMAVVVFFFRNPMLSASEKQ